MQGREGLRQPIVAPVEDVIVGEGSDIDPRHCQQRHVRRMHPVMNPLARPGFTGGGEACLQIDELHFRLPPLQQLRQGIAPDVGEVDRMRDRAAAPLRQLHVLPGVPHVRLEELRRCRMGEDLVDPAPGHDVAAEEEGDSGKGEAGVHDGKCGA